MQLKAAFIVASIIPVVTHAQQLRSLGRPTAEFQEPFTRVATLRELSDGRVIVGDEHDATLQVIDFRAGTGTKIGRTGSGPREYLSMARLLELPNDTTALHDPRNSRI